MTTPVEQKISNSHIIEGDLASFVAGSMVSLDSRLVKVGVNPNNGNFLVILTSDQKSNGEVKIIEGMDKDKPSPQYIFSRLEEEINKIEWLKGSYRQTSTSSDSKGMVYVTLEKQDVYQ